MSLLPSQGPDASAVQEGDVEVVGIDEDVEDLVDALASDTARAVLNAIYEDPGTPSEIADRLEMSIQKVSYHLDKLEDRDLIAVAGTRYSEKGQEMTVYEPPDEPLVLFVGTSDRKRSLKDLVKRLLPTVGALAVGSVLVDRFLSASPSGASGDPTVTNLDGGDGGNDLSLQSTGSATETADLTARGADAATPAGDAVAASGTALSPGMAFFLGGLLILTLVVGWWCYRQYAQNEV